MIAWSSGSFVATGIVRRPREATRPGARRTVQGVPMADYGPMTVPDWRTWPKGSRAGVALWLHTEIAPGGSFTKQQLRDAFPSVEQIDRRMRDLRAEGWVITTYREDRSLSADELRLVQEGGAVWEKGYQSRRQTAVTDKQRQAVFAADNYSCVYCGISGGEPYPDDLLRTAKLTLARVAPVDGGSAQLATCCDRCHVARPTSGSSAQLLEQIDALSGEQHERLAEWVRQGSRSDIPEHELWAQYRRLPHDARQAVAAVLRSR
jgi:hypothetical protein